MLGRFGFVALAIAIASTTTPDVSAAAPPPAEAASLSDLQREADRAEQRGDLEHALQTWQRIGERLGGASASDRMIAAGRGSEILLAAGEVVGARTWSDAQLRIVGEALGTASREHAEAQLHRAEIERRAGDYTEALRRSKAALAGFHAAGTPAPLLTSVVRARILLDMGDVAGAEREASAAMEAARPYADDRPLDLAAAAAALGRARLENGAYASARALLQIAVDFERAEFHRAHPRVCDHLVALAEAELALGRTAAADRNLRTALVGRRMAWPKDGLAVAEVAVAFGASFVGAGDHELARGELTYALDLLAPVVTPGHRLRAIAAARLAELELARGQPEPARERLADAERGVGASAADPLRVRLVALRARERRLAGDPDGAARLLGSSLGDVSAAPPAVLAEVLVEQAEFLAWRGEIESAVRTHATALGVVRDVYGPEHRRVAELLRTDAALQLRAGRIGEATQRLVEAEAIHERVLAERLEWGSERRKRSFVRSLAGETDDIVALAVGPAAKDAAAVELAASTILRRKGRVLDASTADLDALRRRATEPDRQLLARAQRLRALVASHRLQGPGDRDYAQYLDEIADAESRLHALDSTVSRRTAGFARPKWRIDADNVAAALPAGAVLLEYYRFAAPAGEDRYAVFAIAADGSIGAVDLGPAAPIDENVEALRAGLMRSDGAFEAAARRGFAQLLQPVASRFANAKAIFVSPDSSLNLVPFAALMDDTGAFFIDRHASSYVSSGRDLLAMGERSTPRTGPVVFADPDFGQPRTTGRTAAPLSEAQFSALPGTAREAEALRRLLPAPTVYARADATEAKLRQVAGPSILHVATHGFFLGAPQSAPDGGGSTRDRGLVYSPNEAAPARVEVDDPLLRSGLALAGANVHVARDDDGIMTASELLSLDLHGTQLVVLSACETGVGELATGDGVYGLRRSLVVAGTATQVMSLWQVDDAATHELMVAFYDRLMSGRVGRAQAMHDAQLAVRRERPHPYYWAGFFVSGNPTPLPIEAREGPPGAEAGGCRCSTPDPGGPPVPLLLLAFAWPRARPRSRTRRTDSRTPRRT